MRFAVDPWDPGYGAAGGEMDLAASEASVVLDLEVPLARWSAIVPPADRAPQGAVVFVDGVRRLEARAWVSDADASVMPGIFASFAAGTVRCDAGCATIGEIVVGRGVYSPAPVLADVPTAHGTFTAHRAGDATMDALTFAVHDDMARAEVEVAERARRGGDELILLDGPLRKRGHIPDAVGLIKSHHVRYLPPELDRVLLALHAGERTPLFRIESPPYGKASWYVRLPGDAPSPYSSVLRCEATGALPTDVLVALADRVSGSLSRFASAPHKDPRAPQNLYPIGGLERTLRRRLGDAAIIYRALRQAAVTAAA